MRSFVVFNWNWTLIDRASPFRVCLRKFSCLASIEVSRFSEVRGRWRRLWRWRWCYWLRWFNRHPLQLLPVLLFSGPDTTNSKFSCLLMPWHAIEIRQWSLIMFGKQFLWPLCPQFKFWNIRFCARASILSIGLQDFRSESSRRDSS